MEKNKKSGLLNLLVFFVVIAVIIAAFYGFANSNRERSASRNLQYIEDSAVRTAEMIDSEIAAGFRNLRFLSGFIGKSMTSPEVDYDKIREFTEDSGFDFIEFADAEGMSHDAEGSVFDVSDRSYYIDGMSGGTGLEALSSSRISHEPMLVLYAPVMYGGEPCGVLAGAFRVNSRLTELLTVDIFGERADTFLLTPEGRAAASNNALADGSEATAADIADGDSAVLELLSKAIESGETTAFTLDGRAGCITRLQESGWYLLQLFPKAAGEEMIRSADLSGVKLEVSIIAVMLLAALITILYQKKNGKALEAVTDELSGYKNAVLADATIAFDADITNNVITNGAWKGANGRLISIEEALGISLPCSYDEYIVLWADKFVNKEYREMFLKMTSREYMMQSLSRGKTGISFDYEAKAADGSNMFARRSIFLAHNKSGNVIAYCSVRNINEQHRKDEQMIQYEKMLAMVASGTYKGIRMVELENFSSTYISFENGRISEQKIGSWAAWLTRQKANVHPDDYEHTRSVLCEESLSKMEPDTSFSVDFRNAVCGADGRYKTFRVTAFKNESAGKTYVYLVTIETTDEVSKAEALIT